MNTVKWSELTSKDIEKIDKDEVVVILPIGSIEVHGPHLPLGTDTMVIYHVSLEAAKRDGKCLVLPPLYYAYVPENRHFPGTISLSYDTFLKVLEDIVDEVSRQGFRKILIVNGHGGNRRPLRLFLRHMLERGTRAEIYILVDTLAPIKDVIEEIRETGVYEHACEIETSLILYLAPKLVKLERVTGEAKLGKRWLAKGLETMVDWQRYAIMGYVGDPRKASKEKGEKLIKHWIDELVKIIKIVREDKEYNKVLERYYGEAYKDAI